MKKSIIILIIIIITAIALKLFSNKIPDQTIVQENNPITDIENDTNINPQITENTHSLIKVSTPTPNQVVSNNFVVNGEAKGFWYFEASFPIELVDSNGNILAQTIAIAQGEWMTENFVPFQATLNYIYSGPQTTGKLIFRKDNPSGEPQNDDSFEIPVIIQ